MAARLGTTVRGAGSIGGSVGASDEKPVGKSIGRSTGHKAAGRALAALGGALALTAATVAPAAAGTAHRAPARHAPAVHYTALGDSYTSGPLIPTQVDANCARSDHNYPSLVAAADRIGDLDDVSCSGATTAEMWQPQGTNGPQLDAVTRDSTLVTLLIGGYDVGFGSIIASCAGLSVTYPAVNPCQQHYTASGTD
ncbi:MAG: hypothetical protein QOF98_1233, partial [Streptomyces sp.]|nr:hypothetical protein [Streptomyces sp.]